MYEYIYASFEKVNNTNYVDMGCGVLTQLLHYIRSFTVNSLIFSDSMQ